MWNVIGKTSTGLGVILLTIVSIAIVKYALKNTVGKLLKRVYISENAQLIIYLVLFLAMILFGSYLIGDGLSTIVVK